MIPAISQACTLTTPFADDIVGLAGGGATAVEVWLPKLEAHLEANSVADTLGLVRARNLRLVAASAQTGLLLSQGAERRAAFDQFRARLDLCQTFAVPVMVVAADFPPRPDETGLQRAMVSLVQAARWAAGFEVRLALEFDGGAGFCTNLDTAISLVDQCNEPNVGVCLDAFHYHKGPSKPHDLARLTLANLAHVQACDVAGVPREWMTDADRVFPGEGDFELDPVFARLRAIQYAGAVSLEMMNPVLYAAKPAQVAELGLTALGRYAGKMRGEG